MCTRIGDALSRHVGTAQHCHPTSALIPPVIRSSALQRSLLSTLHPCNSSHRHHISHRFPASAQRGSHPRPGGMLEAAGDLCHSTGSLLAPSSPQSHSRAPANPSTHASNGTRSQLGHAYLSQQVECCLVQPMHVCLPCQARQRSQRRPCHAAWTQLSARRVPQTSHSPS